MTYHDILKNYVYLTPKQVFETKWGYDKKKWIPVLNARHHCFGSLFKSNGIQFVYQIYEYDSIYPGKKSFFIRVLENNLHSINIRTDLGPRVASQSLEEAKNEIKKLKSVIKAYYRLEKSCLDPKFYERYPLYLTGEGVFMRVTIEEVQRLKLVEKISYFSYISLNKFAYLCEKDMSVFVKEKQWGGDLIPVNNIYIRDESILELHPYTELLVNEKFKREEK